MNSVPDHRILNNALKSRDSRGSFRSDVEIAAAVREPGLGNVDAMILDLSTTGFRMNCLIQLNKEKVIFLKLPSFSSLESKICWQKGDCYGCEFGQSLHPAVYNHIIAKYPSLQMVG